MNTSGIQSASLSVVVHRRRGCPRSSLARFVVVASLLLNVASNTSDAQEQVSPPAIEHHPSLVVQLGHSGPVTSVALSGDARWLVTGSQDKTARLWEVATGKEVRAFQGHTGYVHSVSMSKDGKWLVTGGGGGDHTARLWEVATGKEVRAFKGHTGAIWSVALSADGKWLATGSADATARVWEVATGKKVRDFNWTFLGFSGRGEWPDGEVKPVAQAERGDGRQPDRPGLPHGEVHSVALSADGKWLATGHDDTTARLWDAATGQQVRVFRGHTQRVTSVALSVDGKRLVTGSWDRTARLWEVSTGKEVRAFLDSSSVNSVGLSANGKQLVTGNEDRTVRLWDADTGKEVREFKGHFGGLGFLFAVALSGDAKWVVTGNDGVAARLWEVATGREVRAFAGQSSRVTSVVLSADEKWIATGNAATAQLWDAATGQQVRTFRGHTGWVTSVALSGDGKRLVTGSDDTTARLWDAATGKVVRAFEGHSGRITSVSLSADGKWLATGSSDATARVWEVATGKELHAFRRHSVWGTAVSLSADGKWLATSSSGEFAHESARLWNVGTGKEVCAFPDSEWVSSVALSADGKWLITDGPFNSARLWEMATGKEVRIFQGHSEAVDAMALSADGRRPVTGSRDHTARLWDAATGRELRAFKGHSDWVTSVALSADGRRLVTGSNDHTTRVWDVATGRELCRLVSFQDGTWAVVDADGRYDASNGGQVNGLHWVVGDETVDLYQLKERYYDPYLLAKYLGVNTEPLRKVNAFRHVRLFPRADLGMAPRSSELAIDLSNRGGGIGQVQVLVNGTELVADARGPEFEANAPRARLNVDLSAAPTLKAGEANRVEVMVWNREGYLSSRRLATTWTAPGVVDRSEPELHAIVVGISKYSAPDLNLNFPARDAEAMASALEMGAKRLFGTERAHLTLLTASRSPRARPPTRANIEAAFTRAREVKPGDVLVVYLAGHGVTLSGDVYCYLTQEARTLRTTDLADPAVRAQSAVTIGELAEWIKRIPALKKVMILDTCAAGAAARKLVEARSVSGEQRRAIDRLKDRTGFHVLMGSAADRASYEATQYAQGLLTYALLKGMRGAAIAREEYVDVATWFQYAADEVPRLAAHVGGIQKPEIVTPFGGASFDVGRLTREDKATIPVAQPKPLVLRPLLIERDEGDDTLGLMSLVRKKLGDETTTEDVKVVFVDADEMPGAIRPTGTYTVSGEMVKVRLNLRRDGKTIATIPLDGDRRNLNALVDAIAQEIERKSTPGG